MELLRGEPAELGIAGSAAVRPSLEIPDNPQKSPKTIQIVTQFRIARSVMKYVQAWVICSSWRTPHHSYSESAAALTALGILPQALSVLLLYPKELGN